MVEVLRDLASGADSYLQRFQDFQTLNRLNFDRSGDNEDGGDNDDDVSMISSTVNGNAGISSVAAAVLWKATNDRTLNDINEFARQISTRCSTLANEVEPIFDKLSSTTDSQLDRAVRLLASRYNESPERIDELVSLFLKLTGKKSEQLRYEYERAVLLNDRGPRFVENSKKLYFNVMSEVDRTIVRSVNLTELLDVRELLSRDDLELAMLSEYLKRSISSNEVTLFDLLFRPRVTLTYVPRIVGLLVMRQIGLDKLSELFDWIRWRSLELRTNAHEESESLNNELTRLNFARKEIEDDFVLTTIREKPYYERYLTLVRYKHETRERINELNRRQLRVQSAIRFLGNTTRVVDYYVKLEYNYLVNLTDDFRHLTTDVDNEESIDLVESLSNRDADTLRSVTNAYRDYREVLLKYIKVLYSEKKAEKL